jgi:hypothetical protein
MAAVIAAWMLARRRDSDRIVAAAVDVKPEYQPEGGLADAACALVLGTEPSSVEVAGIGLAGPEQLDEAITEARRRWGSGEPAELFVQPASPFGAMPATSSAFALAHAVEALRSGKAKSALVASRGTTASVAMILTSNEVTDAD